VVAVSLPGGPEGRGEWGWGVVEAALRLLMWWGWGGFFLLFCLVFIYFFPSPF
jgi:hypothetical protein